MAKTTFTVMNLNPDFEFPDGFWFANRSDGGENLNTDDDGTDDVIAAPGGSYSDDKRGTWVWCNGTEFEVDGDVAVRGSRAFMMNAGLLAESFVWLPKNPAWNTVAPLLKDGVTANPDYDPSGNPALHSDGTTPASKVAETCRHFTVSTIVATAAVVLADDDEDEDDE